jgi:hypothetical protein
MGFRFCLVLVIFFFTATLISAVYLSDTRSRVFYQVRRCQSEQGRLQQELWQKQLRVEGLINPASISERLGRQVGPAAPR